MGIRQFFSNMLTGGGAQGGMMAPNFSQQMFDSGNKMLENQGMSPYQPFESPFFSNQFVDQHPRLSAGLGGALGVLANMEPTSPYPTSAGANIANVARGVMGNAMMQRNFHLQQAMMPFQIASQVAQYRKSVAPEAVFDKYGNAYKKDPFTGNLALQFRAGGLTPGQTPSMADQEQNVVNSIPNLTDSEKANIHARMGLAGGILDPEQQSKFVADLPGDLYRERNSAGHLLLSQQQFQHKQDMDTFRKGAETTRLDLMRKRFGLSEAQMRMRGMESMMRFGINMYTGETLSPSNAPTGMLLDDNGNPVPIAFNGNIKPTNAAKSKAEQAEVIKTAGDTLIAHLSQFGGDLGPVLGRYNSLADFVGSPPPDYKYLASEIASWIALHPAAHGFRGVRAVEEFQKAFGGTYNTPESLVSGIRGAYNTMDALQSVGTPNTVSKPKPNPMLPPGSGDMLPDPKNFLRKNK
jgi:hypothetical protein